MPPESKSIGKQMDGSSKSGCWLHHPQNRFFKRKRTQYRLFRHVNAREEIQSLKSERR